MRATGAARAGGARTLPCRSSGSATAEAELDMSPNERLAEGAAAAMVGCLAGGHVGEAAANYYLQGSGRSAFESSTNFAPAPAYSRQILRARGAKMARAAISIPWRLTHCQA